ncbi:hypothetical protein ACFL3I_04320 [Pseudomonadota bacterium]
MKRSVRYVLTLLATVLMSSSALATIDFSDDFESYTYPPDGGAIGGGWTWFLNAYPNFPVCDGYIGNYGPNPAPNDNSDPYGVSNIVIGDTNQALNVFTDYGSPDQPLGNCVEVNVFQERLLTSSDTGLYTFRFDTQVPGPLGEGVQAYAFIKLINPDPPYNTVEFLKAETIEGGTKSINITLDSADAGLLLQWGFANVASNYLPSSRYYDNVSFAIEDSGPDPDPDDGDAIGLPIPFWAFIALVGLLAFVGGSKLRSRREQ